MPSGPRIRTDNVYGTTTDAPLAAGATTMNSAGLANLAAVSSAHAIIILDPLRSAGAPEAVVVTAHTASATSATITRAAYGTSAREHAAGTLWVHAPTVEDFIRIVTASTRPSDPYEGQLIYETDTDRYSGYTGSAWATVAQLGAWSSWSPTWTNVTVGSGTVVARYVQIGKTVHFYLKFTFGAGSAMGDAIFTLPATASATIPLTASIGQIQILDSGTANFFGTAWLHSTTEARAFVNTAGSTYVQPAAFSTTVPMTWATNDFFIVTGAYEAA